jgi:hypothetical protein
VGRHLLEPDGRHLPPRLLRAKRKAYDDLGGDTVKAAAPHLGRWGTSIEPEDYEVIDDA